MEVLLYWILEKTSSVLFLHAVDKNIGLISMGVTSAQSLADGSQRRSFATEKSMERYF